MDDFKEFIIRKNLVPKEKATFYLLWINRFLKFENIQDLSKANIDEKQINNFANNLEKNHEEWQVNQARYALRLFMFFQSHNHLDTNAPNTKPAVDQWKNLAAEMVKVLRLRHLAKSTENTYLYWLRMFYVYLHFRGRF